MLGLRVSELAALKWKDIIDDKQLHVVRGEVRDQNRGVYTVVNHTKVYRDRYVEIPPKVIEILEDWKKKSNSTKDDDYIFVRNGERITARQITYVLEKYARNTNHEVKRSHKIRKTYASRMSVDGVPTDTIRIMLGHSNLQTTLSYIFNPLAEEETRQRVISVFSDS